MRTGCRRRSSTLISLVALTVIAGACSAVSSGSTTPAPSGGRDTPPAATAPPSKTARVCAPPYPNGAVTSTSVFCQDPASLTAASVIRIVDGDTLHVELNGRDETVRLYGINATEVGQPCSAEATARLKALAGAQVLLRPDARDRDRFRRLLRYVYSANGLSIDAELVDEGLAYAWRSDGDLRFAIIELEAQARAAHRGCLPS